MSKRRSAVLVIAASLATAVLMTAVPAVAKAGDNLILGTKNSSGNQTTELESTVQGGPGLKVENDAGGVWSATRINVGCLTNDPEEKESCAPGFATDTAGRVKHFNADKLDSLHANEIVTNDLTAKSGISSTTNLVFQSIPGAQVSATVPPGPNRDAVVTLHAENRCTQAPVALNWCYVRILVDGNPVGKEIVLNSVQQGANSEDTSAWAAHGFSWVVDNIAPGEHTIEAQFRVSQANSQFSIDDLSLRVETFVS